MQSRLPPSYLGRKISPSVLAATVLLLSLVVVASICVPRASAQGANYVTGVGPWVETTDYGAASGSSGSGGIPILGQSCVGYQTDIYCVGGQNADTGTDLSNVYYSQVSSSGTLGAWVETTDYGAASGTSGSGGIGIEFTSCVQYIGYIYCIGGAKGGPPTSDVFYAQLSSSGVGPWTETTDYGASSGTSGSGGVPTSLDSCATDGGYVACVGDEGGTSKVFFAQLSSSGVGPWTETTDYGAPSGDSGTGGVAIGSGVSCVDNTGYIYCVGGTVSFQPVSDVFYAQLNSSGVGPWTEATDYGASSGTSGSGGVPVYATSCDDYNSSVICVGGATTGNSDVSSVYYAPVDQMGAWVLTGPYFLASYHFSCVPILGFVICTGGLTSKVGVGTIQPTSSSSSSSSSSTTETTTSTNTTETTTPTTTESTPTSTTTSTTTTTSSSSLSTTSSPSSTTTIITTETTPSTTTTIITSTTTPTTESTTSSAVTTSGVSSSNDSLFIVIAVLVVLVAVGGFLFMSRRGRGKPTSDEAERPPPPTSEPTFTPATYAPDLGPPPTTTERPPPPQESPPGTKEKPPPPPPLYTTSDDDEGCKMKAKSSDEESHFEVDVDLSDYWENQSHINPSAKSDLVVQVEDTIRKSQNWDHEMLGAAVAVSDGAAVGGSVDAGAKVWLSGDQSLPWSLFSGEQRRLEATSHGRGKAPIEAKASGKTSIDLEVETMNGVGGISAAALGVVKARASVLEVAEKFWEFEESFDFYEKIFDILLHTAPPRFVNNEEFKEELKEIQEIYNLLKEYANSPEATEAKEALKDAKDILKKLGKDFGEEFTYAVLIPIIIEKGGKWLWANANVEVEAEGSLTLQIGGCEEESIDARASMELEVKSSEIEKPPEGPDGERQYIDVRVRKVLASCSAADELTVEVEGEVEIEGLAFEGGEGNAYLDSMWASVWAWCCKSDDDDDDGDGDNRDGDGDGDGDGGDGGDDDGGDASPQKVHADGTFGARFVIPASLDDDYPDMEDDEIRNMISVWMQDQLDDLLRTYLATNRIPCPADDPNGAEAALKEILENWLQAIQEKWSLFTN